MNKNSENNTFPTDTLVRHLFSDPRLTAYAVLDGAANPALLDYLYNEDEEKRPDFVCLYRGELEPDIAECAPYLVELQANAPFTDWVTSHCWGNNWGIFAVAEGDLLALRQHFRKLNIVYDPETYEPLLFRYYDPRVLRVFLPTCDTEQFSEFFGPVEAFFTESEEGTCLARFYRNELVQDLL